MSESLSLAMSILDPGVLRMSSGASQPSGGWSCSVVWWYSSEYFCIFCQMAAGWTEVAGAGRVSFYSIHKEPIWIHSKLMKLQAQGHNGPYAKVRYQEGGKNGIGTSLVSKRLCWSVKLRGKNRLTRSCNVSIFLKKRKELLLLLNAALWC